MDFEEYFRKNFNDGLSESSKYILRFTFEAGQQSKQAEVDELQKRIDEALKYLTRTDITSINIARSILKGACDE